jgi:hypothetical protein
MAAEYYTWAGYYGKMSTGTELWTNTASGSLVVAGISDPLANAMKDPPRPFRRALFPNAP